MKTRAVPIFEQKLFSQIVEVILKYKEPEKIYIFGSRARNDFNGTSDIDIAIFGKKWSDTDINLVKHNLDEIIPTPLKFDVVNFYNISKTKLKENILRDGKPIYDSGKD